ncbi:MAG: thioredoxin-dependent thiol peroxidase [bacterium]|nr:thioredoxin-dependent thiol peroxidase [bacterium]
MTEQLIIGSPAPALELENQDDQVISLDNFNGKWVVLYFYPKDNTSGCTVEAIDFTALLGQFGELEAEILGVSPDSTKSHRNFIEKKELGITLLSDPEHKVAGAYGAWQLKKNYGREYYGIVRSTFLIDPSGNIAFVWTKVKAKGHAEIVKTKLLELRG